MLTGAVANRPQDTIPPHSPDRMYKLLPHVPGMVSIRYSASAVRRETRRASRSKNK
jgi:hypothetical protein